MQILSRSILLLLRRLNVATFPAPMHRLSSLSRSLLSFMALAPPSWWPPAHVRRVLPIMVAPNPPVRRVSRFPHGSRNMASRSGVKGEELGKPEGRLLIPSANDIMISLGEHTTKEFVARSAHGEEDERRTSVNIIYGDEDAFRSTLEVIDDKRDATGEIVDVTGCEPSSGDEESWAAERPVHLLDDVFPSDILPFSSHRDGSIYRDTNTWKTDYRIWDRSETRLEAMMLSDPPHCDIEDGICILHRPKHMLQIFSLKLAKIHVEAGSVELYGYIAARDRVDPFLNFVINFSREDPIVMEQGSLINMAGPKRGINLLGTILIEYDMRIKVGEREKDDLQLIDGVSILDDIDTEHCRAFTERIIGDCGAVDITGSRLENAVEATVEVVISEVQSVFNLCLGCFTSGLDEEVRIFDGAIGESCGLKRSVVAVVMGAQMDLKFKVGAGSSIPAVHCCSFKADQHGRAAQEIKSDFALISVKVTWSTLPDVFNAYNLSAQGLSGHTCGKKTCQTT